MTPAGIESPTAGGGRGGAAGLGPVRRVAAGGMARRRVQTVVIGLVLLVSCLASVLALGLVVESQSPFDHAFAAQRGADVTAVINSSRASAAQLAATERLAGVTAAAGPFRETTVTAQVSGSGIGTLTIPPLTLAGRASPGGPVDHLVLQSGHWPTADGQIVLAAGQSGPDIGVPLHSKVTLLSVPGHPTLTVVGTANSVTGSASGWVLPAEVTRLSSASTTPSELMLYRFASASTATQLRTDAAAITGALPTGAVTGTQNYLSAKFSETGNAAPFVPFLIAFGVIGVVMSVLITANVVSGAVVAGYRRIGVLKSIGFSPAQVVAAYTSQIMVSAVVGCLAGVALGNVLAAPVLGHAADVYEVGALHVPFWLDVIVPVAMCCLVALAAVLPALRAGRLSAVQAIATGRAPRTGRGYAAHRLFGRLPLPRPTTIGLAAPFARPARTAMTMTAIALGAAAVTLAVGLTTSLNLVIDGLSHSHAEPVQVQVPGSFGPIQLHPGHGKVTKPPAGGPSAGSPPTSQLPTPAVAERTVEAALRSEPGTLRYVAEADRLVSIAGLSQPVSVTAFRGDSSWTGYDMIKGHWYAGVDQVDVGTHFLTETGTKVGDMVTLQDNGTQIRVKIVGQIFSTDNDGLMMVTGWQTLAKADPTLTAMTYDVALRPGVSATAYAEALGSKLGSSYFVSVNTRHSSVLDAMLALVGILTLLLAIVAGLGVLNTVVLNTRERVHDLGVFKVVGMTPRQTTAMAVCWVAGIGLIAGLVAVPIGIVLLHQVLPAMAAAADVGLPASFLNVYHGGELAILALAGAAIAVAGALLPASWAAAIRTGAALRAE
ncbi:MAG TPA: FtsX-like permease family protein [Streptosporangiaceae bacterium]